MNTILYHNPQNTTTLHPLFIKLIHKHLTTSPSTPTVFPIKIQVELPVDPEDNKIKPLFIADLGPDADLEEIRKNLKPMPKNPSILKLIGAFKGPKDMSINKRKYLAKHVLSNK